MEAWGVEATNGMQVCSSNEDPLLGASNDQCANAMIDLDLFNVPDEFAKGALIPEIYA